MELRDLAVTPIVIIIVYAMAYVIRPYVTDEVTRKYFLPALTVKIVGALALGFIYQYYYEGGDTYNFHTNGSRPIWEAFLDSPAKGIKLIFNDGSDYVGVYQYASRIYFFGDSSSYFIVRIASFFDILTFSTYSATAVLFACISLVGTWMFFLTFYKQAPSLHPWFALASFFVPSIIFWGSGILKDTVVLACLGMATFQIYRIFFEKKFTIWTFLLLAVSLYSIFMIRKFVLQAYLPAVMVWLFTYYFGSIRSKAGQTLLAPIVIVIFLSAAYFLVSKVGEDDPRYSVENLALTAKITAYDIRYWTGRDAGSGYSLGTLDGSVESMIRLAPQAVNVSLFRPYLWEVNNPLMLLSSLESLFMLCLCIYVVAIKRTLIFDAIRNPNVIFALSFSILFAFAVGVSTFNFGTLARYKIPLMPFFIVAVSMMLTYEKSERKLEELETSE